MKGIVDASDIGLVLSATCSQIMQIISNLYYLVAEMMKSTLFTYAEIII